MRLISSNKAEHKGEISVLALIETLIAVSLVVFLSVKFNTLKWLSIAMCVSPLLLLRTEQSTALAITIFDGIVKLTGRVLTFIGLKTDRFKVFARPAVLIPTSPIGIMGLILVSGMARISATIIASLKSPISTAKAIPTNWGRVVLSLDSMTLPELIPEHPDIRFEKLPEIFTRETYSGKVVAIMLSAVFVPSIFYRWSLKATSIIYAPLVFVARSTFKEEGDLRTTLELIRRSDIVRIRLIYGIVFLLLFILKLALTVELIEYSETHRKNAIVDFLFLYIAIGEIPRWQVAELINFILVIVDILLVREALRRYELNVPFPETSFRRVFGFLHGIRWIPLLYAILCLGYITIRETQNMKLPPLGNKWFPW